MYRKFSVLAASAAYVLAASPGLAQTSPQNAQPVPLTQTGTLPVTSLPDRIFEIEVVIRAQINAFKKDDKKTAFAFAGPRIQQAFGTPDRFMEMVQRGYPQIYRAEKLVFLPLAANENGIIQRVLITGKDGTLVTAIYTMVQIHGLWRIDGCTLKKGDQDI